MDVVYLLPAYQEGLVNLRIPTINPVQSALFKGIRLIAHAGSPNVDFTLVDPPAIVKSRCRNTIV